MSTMNFGSYSSLQAALLVLVIYYVGEFFLDGKGPIIVEETLFKRKINVVSCLSLYPPVL